MNNDDLVRAVTAAVVKGLQDNKYHKMETCQILPENKNYLPLGVSNRHVHLARDDLSKLFGVGAQLTKFKDLSQPGQFACAEKLTLIGPKGIIENVRILGPTRSKTQVELAVSDCIKLGITAPVRDSGDLQGSAGLTLVGPQGAITIAEGAIVAARHVHMHTGDAQRLNLKDGDRICVKFSGPRSLIFNEVLVRVSENYRLEMHLDYDEANAANISGSDFGEIVKL